MNQTTRCRPRGSDQDRWQSLGHGEDVNTEEKLAVVTNRRVGCTYGTESTSEGSSCPPPSYQGHWCEEDKLFPLKKRRVIFTSKVSASLATDREQKESVREPTRITEKSLKPWVRHYKYPENEEEQEKNEAKKKLSGEGRGKIQVANLRCSRKSGRGWRCNRLAILGHTRCEHHLSQAKLANRNRRTRYKNNINLKKVYPILYSEQDEDEDNGKRFDKGGVGKARSISCLLGQTAPIRTVMSKR